MNPKNKSISIAKELVNEVLQGDLKQLYIVIPLGEIYILLCIVESTKGLIGFWCQIETTLAVSEYLSNMQQMMLTSKIILRKWMRLPELHQINHFTS